MSNPRSRSSLAGYLGRNLFDGHPRSEFVRGEECLSGRTPGRKSPRQRRCSGRSSRPRSLTCTSAETTRWYKSPGTSILPRPRCGSGRTARDGLPPTALESRSVQGFGARTTVGFCWPWSDPRPDGSLVEDVQLGTWSRPRNVQRERRSPARSDRRLSLSRLKPLWAAPRHVRTNATNAARSPLSAARSPAMYLARVVADACWLRPPQVNGSAPRERSNRSVRARA